jgi:hypothetical protein
MDLGDNYDNNHRVVGVVDVGDSDGDVGTMLAGGGVHFRIVDDDNKQQYQSDDAAAPVSKNAVWEYRWVIINVSIWTF